METSAVSLGLLSPPVCLELPSFISPERDLAQSREPTPQKEKSYNAGVTYPKLQQISVPKLCFKEHIQSLKYHRVTNEIFVPVNICQITHLRVLKRCSFF